MLVVVFTSFLAILLAYFGSTRGRKGLEVAFAIVTFVGCIHYDYGNDYMNYYGIWQQIKDMSFKDMMWAQKIYGEKGWHVLNWLFTFSENGFFIMVAFLQIVQNFIFYRFIKVYLSPKHYWFGTLIYLMTTGLYLMSFSMMRQGLSIALFLASFQILCPKSSALQKTGKPFKKIIRIALSFSVIYLATTFHTSAYICFPFLLLCLFPLNNIKPFLASVIFFAAILLVFSDIISGAMSYLFSFEALSIFDDRYDSEAKSLGLGFALNSVPHIVYLFYLWKNASILQQEYKLLLVLALSGFIFAPMALVTTGMVNRIAMYFSPFSLVAIPYSYSKINNNGIKSIVMLVYFFMAFYQYLTFFFSRIYGPHYIEFHSIFEVL